jgi:hypothetical protein
MKRSEFGRTRRLVSARPSRRRMLECSAAAVLSLAVAAGTRAQFNASQKPPEPPPQGRLGRQLLPPPGPMGGVFSFVEPLSDVSAKVVKDAPFSAVVVRETIQSLADGNRIDHKSTGKFDRDSQGRTRREMTLANIGPWAAAGKAPHLVFINDPVAGKVFTLDEARKTAYEMPPGPRLRYAPRRGDRARARGRRARRWQEFKRETQTESLGRKTMEGLQVDGTRIVRTIPAGQIGNEKPIVITTVRWYSPQLQTTILLKRTDPRFGTTLFQLKKIRLSNPSESLFAVPSDYTVKARPARRERRGRRRDRRPPNFP